jgi:hypothetical protein
MPVDCISEGRRKLYINPIECIDCGAGGAGAVGPIEDDTELVAGYAPMALP